MKNNLPDIIHEVGFDFNWSNPKVWALDLPAEDMEISQLIWHFDYPFIWPIPEGRNSLTPYEVLKNPELFNDEYIRTINADISFPIDVMFWKEKWLILDGLHRLMKQYINGDQTVQVRKVPKSMVPLILK